jgi:hypothetical protein
LFAALLCLNNLLKAIFRTRKVSFLDLLLAFLATLLTVAALMINMTGDVPDPLVNNWALVLGVILIVSSVVIIIVELFRPERLKGSRGLLGLFGGVMIAFSTFTVPFVSTYFDIRADLRNADANPVGTPVAQAEVTEELDPTQAAQVRQRERAAFLFNAIRAVITAELDLEDDVILRELEMGRPLADLIRENGGDIERVIDGITEVMSTSIRESVELGEISPIQAALILSQMENFVRIAANSDLSQLESRFGGATPMPGTPTDMSLIGALTGTPDATDAALESTQAAPSATPILSETPTRTETLTRTPRPTNTPFPTRQRYATRTPLPTATLVTPCLANVEYNLRLRSTPEQIDPPNDNTLLVIPFATVIELYGKSEDGLWWLTIYDGQRGWVVGEFMTISAACDRIPVVEQ